MGVYPFSIVRTTNPPSQIRMYVGTSMAQGRTHAHPKHHKAIVIMQHSRRSPLFNSNYSSNYDRSKNSRDNYNPYPFWLKLLGSDASWSVSLHSLSQFD